MSNRTLPHIHSPVFQTTSHGDSTLLPDLYAMDEDHGWSQGMRFITHTLLATAGVARGVLLEVGCGSGIFLREAFERTAPDLCVGLDRSSLALMHADQQATPLPLTQADLQHLPFVDQAFDVIIALDSLDQRAVTLPQALAECWRVLQPGGLLLLRVSAHPWLHSAHDAAFNTGRRYRRREMIAALHAQKFQRERVTYANSLLALPIILQRFLQRWRLLSVANHQAPLPLINQQVARLLRWEARLLRSFNLPFGISLYVLARKHL